jgi:phage virion morphogenesis protein
MIELEYDAGDVLAALSRLADASGDIGPVMRQIGEHLVDSTRQRFRTSTAPDGSAWEPNAQSTYLGYLGAFGGSASKKTGRLTKAGAGRAAGKKPLIGETRILGITINYRVDGDTLYIGSPRVDAPTHQFGAKKHSFTGGKTPWGDIPARPFLGLSAADRVEVPAILQEHLGRAAGR